MKRCLTAGAFLLTVCLLRAGSLLVYVAARPSLPHGIYLLRFDPDRGALSGPVPVAEARNSTFLAHDPVGRRLYVSGELSFEPPVSPAMGGVTAYAIDPASGALNFINQRSTGGNSTTHLAVDSTGRAVVAANFDEGYVCVLPLAADGGLELCSAWIEEHGPLGPDRKRQTQPHPHGVVVSPDNRFMFSCDLGLDRVLGYRLDPVKGLISPNDPPFAATPAGSGPHHGVFSRDGRFFYVVNEMGSSVCVFAYDSSRGALALRQTISALPAGFAGANTSAEILIHPNDRFVYASDRGADAIAVFARNPQDGRLTLVSVEPSGGRIPRSFTLSRDGRWLISANFGSDTLTVFRVDATTGRLAPNRQSAAVKKPFTILFCD
jgi:6-phosphogluconolactonase